MGKTITETYLLEKSPTGSTTVSQRAALLFANDRAEVYKRTDRMFAVLLALQWVAGIVIAWWVSPRVWVGSESRIHLHIWAAIFLGGIIDSLPIFLALRYPGRSLTRHVIAVAQMSNSALLIHLTGGRIETHFHVFGSLAFLACYRDWRVLITATLVVAADHLVRAVVWPQSAFGVDVVSTWRVFEHAAWVIFEDIFLIISFRYSLSEMHRIARQWAQLEETSSENSELTRLIAERTAAEEKLKAFQLQHIETARRAGMAEIATSVLHNVGNVLNSVNVSAAVIGDELKKLGVRDLKLATQMVESHLDDLGTFITADERGKHLPRFLIELSKQMTHEEEQVLTELSSLAKNIEHVKDIVSLQQSYAGISGIVEELSLGDLLVDAIRINAASMRRHGIEVVQEFEELPPVEIEKQKFLQIVVNLISNAKYAIIESGASTGTIRLRLYRPDADRVRVEVIDTGVGIPRENLTRIFQHGFTTRKDGHGFGLHGSANMIKEMQGTLTARSDGPGQGATFTLEIPFKTSGVGRCALAQTM